MTDRRSWTPDQQYEHQRELTQKRAAWDQERKIRRVQEQRDRRRTELQAYLQDRGKVWADYTGSAPPLNVVQGWQQEYVTNQARQKEAERQRKLDEAAASPHYHPPI